MPLRKLFSTLILASILLAGCNAAAPGRASDSAQASPTQTPPGSAARLPTLTLPASGAISPAGTLPAASTPVLTLPPSIDMDAQELRGVQLTFAHPWGGETASLLRERVGAFNRENDWGITVSISATPGSSALLFEQINRAAADRPSVVAAPVNHVVYWQEHDIRVVDLTPYVLDTTWGLPPDDLEDFYAPVLAAEQVNGQRLGFPAERNARVLFYNITWAKELGFDEPPATFEDFQAQVCAAAKANVSDSGWQNDGTGGWIIDRSAATVTGWLQAFGAPLPAAGDPQYRFDTAENARAFDYLRTLFDAGCAWFSRVPQPYEYFATRHALVYSGSLTEITTQAFTQTRLASADTWTVIPFPGQPPVLPAEGLSYAVLGDTPAENLAGWLFIRWMAQPENQAKMVRASGTLPLTRSARAALSDYARQHPQWAAAADLVDLLQPAPSASSWWLASSILEDATWQMLQPTPQPASAILQQVDEMIPEILERRP